MLRRLREIALERAGMSLEQFEDEVIRHKLAPELQRAGGLRRFATLVEADDDALQRFIECLCTHETRFFRHPLQFDYLRTEHLPRLRNAIKRAGEPRRVQGWSAACSTGEEAASLAITLAELFPLGGGVEWNVLATDISRKVLERAARLRWRIELAHHVAPELLTRYFLRGIGSEEGYMRLVPALAATIEVKWLNLVHSPIPRGCFDVILCRNVLIYFPAAIRQQVSRRLLAALTPDGLLFTGPSEGLTQDVAEVEMVAPHVYRRRRDA